MTKNIATENNVEYLKSLFSDKVSENVSHTEGHRERVFKAMENDSNYDFATLSDVHLLEMYLMTLIPRKDVKPIAYDLLETFGTLGAISKAELYELMQIDGIGINTARNLVMCLPFCIRCCESTTQESKRIRRPIDVVNYILPSYMGAIKELAYIIFLDNRERVLQHSLLNKGFVGQVRIDNTKILQIATKLSAAKAILVHNHPSGNIMPSDADIVVTSRLLSMLSRININLIDHIILGKRGNCFSIMKDKAGEVMAYLRNQQTSSLVCSEILQENIPTHYTDYIYSTTDLNEKLSKLAETSNFISNKKRTTAEFNYFTNTTYNEENFLDI